MNLCVMTSIVKTRIPQDLGRCSPGPLGLATLARLRAAARGRGCIIRHPPGGAERRFHGCARLSFYYVMLSIRPRGPLGIPPATVAAVPVGSFLPDLPRISIPMKRIVAATVIAVLACLSTACEDATG